MEGTSYFPPQSALITAVIFVLVESIDVHGAQWSSIISYYTNALRNRFSEEHSHRVSLYFFTQSLECLSDRVSLLQHTRLVFVWYCHGSPVSLVPPNVGGHDETREPPLDGIVVTGESLDLAAFYGYMSIIKVFNVALFASERCLSSLDDRRLTIS